MIGRLIAILIVCLSVPGFLSGQTNKFNSSRGNFGGEGKNAFNSSRTNGFNEQRMKLSAEYIKMTREPWNSFNSLRGIIPPHEKEKPVAPVTISEEDLNKDKENKKIEIETIVSPIIKEDKKKPIAPIVEIDEATTAYINFSFFATDIKIRKPSAAFPRITSTGESSVADMLEKLNVQAFNNMLYDCISLKNTLRLDDWPYLMAIKAFAESVYGKNSNESAVLMAYILGQGGYKVRLARAENKIGLLYACKHKIYYKSYFPIDNDYFYFLGESFQQAQICPAYFSSEKPVSLWITSSPLLSEGNGNTRTLVSKRYPDFNISVKADKNTVQLLDTYPASEIDDNFMTKWAMYASAPISDGTRKDLYSQLGSLISGLPKEEAAERILNWVQTSLVYEYDDKVWGHDRAFFSEETLYYPYADCEDRSILFTRLVRDLLNLECLLVYYPGHLASAVCFDNNVTGDYIEYRNKRYTVCDPTYIGATMGMTMPNMDNSKAKVVVLK